MAAFAIGAVAGGRLLKRLERPRQALLPSLVVEIACTALAGVIAIGLHAGKTADDDTRW